MPDLDLALDGPLDLALTLPVSHGEMTRGCSSCWTRPGVGARW